MSLTTGRGPLSPDPSGRFSAPIPTGVIYVEPYPRRIRGRIGDRFVIDTERVQLVHRPGRPTSYAFLADDVPAELAEPEPAVAGHVSVPWASIDRWYEENVELTFNSYPKNPYHRVDCLPASRRLRVEAAGVVLVETTETLVLHETALPARLYVSKELVRMDLLTPSRTASWCSYKGNASWWTATVDGVAIPDLVWSYEDPLAESAPLRGMLSFDERLAEVVADLPIDLR